jgi:hypothetical protein
MESLDIYISLLDHAIDAYKASFISILLTLLIGGDIIIFKIDKPKLSLARYMYFSSCDKIPFTILLELVEK